MKITVTMTLDTHNPADKVVIDEIIAQKQAASTGLEDLSDDELDDLEDDLMNSTFMNDLYFSNDEEVWWDDDEELEGDLW